MIASIHQPHYLPWFGLLDKIARSDVFVVLDSVQYNKRSFQNRTLYSSQGGAKYISLSILSSGHQTNGLLISDCRLVDPAEGQKHFKTLYHRYGKTPGWKSLETELAEALYPTEKLVDIAWKTMELTMRVFDVNPRIFWSSKVGAEGNKSELMLDISRKVNADEYLSGAGAKDYMNDDLFAAEGIGVRYQEFEHPRYEQGLMGDFQPGCLALESYWLDPKASVALFHKALKR